MINLDDYKAIDPLALIFSGRAYLILIEKLHPHVPKVAEIQEAARSLSPEEKSFALARARALTAYGRAVEEAIAALK